MSQQVNATEAQMPSMPRHVEEGDGAGPALRGVHPVAHPGVIADVRISAIPDIETVKRVIQNRQPYPEEFESDDERESSQQLNLFGIRARTLGGEGVGYEMFDQKQSNRNNSAKRVNPAKKERPTFAGTQRRYAACRIDGWRAGRGCHETPCEFRSETRTFYYVVAGEVKSRKER